MINTETPGVYSPCDHVVGKLSRSYKSWYGEKISEFIEEYSKYNTCICQVSSDNDISIISKVIPNISKIYRTSLQTAIVISEMKYLLDAVSKNLKHINYVAPEAVKSKYTNGIEFLELRLYPMHNLISEEFEYERNKIPYDLLIFRIFYKYLDQVVPKLVDHLHDQKQELRKKLSYLQRRFDILSNININSMKETLNGFVTRT